MPGALTNPQLTIYDGAGALIASNDNWQEAANRDEIIGTGIAPTNDLEASILRLLAPGAYTAVVSGVGGATGVGLVEVYDLDRSAGHLANISSRGLVQTGDEVMIGGFIVDGGRPQNTIVRAIGPSLPVSGVLADPKLEIYNSEGVLIASNNDWRGTQEAEVVATGIPPTHNRESAIVRDIPAGAYTALVRGFDGTPGVALVEVYALD